MLRGFRRLLNVRLFSSSKDPQSLKDQFKKMAEQQTHKAEETPDEEIKLSDHQKATQDLKSKFDAFRSDLGKNTGQAKSVFEKLYETAKTLKAEDFTSKFKSKEKPETPSKPSESPPDEPITKSTSESQQAPPKVEPEQIDLKEALNPLNETKTEQSKGPSFLNKIHKSYTATFPRTSYYTDKSGNYIRDLWRETFPQAEDKIQRLIRIHEQRKESKLIDEKLARGEMTEDQVPAWKRTALAVIPEKKSSWKKLKEKVSGTVIGDKTATILQSDSVKQVKSKIKDLKDGVSDVKNLVNDALEDSESKILHSAKDMVKESFLETSEGKATRIMRQHDPDFDVYGMENEILIHVRILLEHAFKFDSEYVYGIATAQAKEFFDTFFKTFAHVDPKNFEGKVISLHRCSFLGANCDDKSEPRISYSFRINYLTKIKHEMPEDLTDVEFLVKKVNEGRSKSTVTNMFVTISPHPDPDILKYRHPWKFVVFYPADDMNRVSQSK